MLWEGCGRAFCALWIMRSFMARFRLIDMAAGEIGIVADDRDSISEGETVAMPDGRGVEVVEVYDDEEHGQEGGVAATLVVNDGSEQEEFTH
jgi:hypothetical protein